MAVTFKGERIDKYEAVTAEYTNNFEKNEKGIYVEKERMAPIYANLPEGVTKKQYEEIKKVEDACFNAAHISLAQSAANDFKNDPELQEVVGEFQIGPNNRTKVAIARSKSYPNPQHKENPELPAEITKHLQVRTSSKNKGRDYEAIRRELSTRYEEMI